MEVKIKKEAKKELEKLDKVIAQRILDAISNLRDFPDVQNIKRLKGNPIRYRLRVGDWRIIFNVSSDALIIETIKHRREAYQK